MNENIFVMSHYFFNWLILENREEIQKTPFLFGSNQNFEICFWDLPTFNGGIFHDTIKIVLVIYLVLMYLSYCVEIHPEICTP